MEALILPATRKSLELFAKIPPQTCINLLARQTAARVPGSATESFMKGRMVAKARGFDPINDPERAVNRHAFRLCNLP